MGSACLLLICQMNIIDNLINNFANGNIEKFVGSAKTRSQCKELKELQMKEQEELNVDKPLVKPLTPLST